MKLRHGHRVTLSRTKIGNLSKKIFHFTERGKKHQTLDELKQRRNITNMTTTHDAHALPSEFSVDGVDGSGTKSSNVGFLWMIFRGTFSVAATPGVWGPLRWWRW